MTGAVLDRPGSLFADAAGRAHGPVDAARPAGARHAADGRVTLEQLLNSTLHEARTNGSTECPVCRARMNARTTSTRARMEGGAGEAVTAECGTCGSRLS